MVLLGVDPHKDTHTVVAVGQAGRQLGQTTVAARTSGHAELLGWAWHRWPEERVGRWRTAAMSPGGWNVTCWPLGSGCAGPTAADGRGPPRRAGLGKSDPIDALAVARAALREPDLPTAGHDQASWEVRLLVDHREHLIVERTRMINRLRWHLHRLDPDLEHTARRLPGPSLGRIAAWLAEVPASAQIDICQELTAKIQTLTSASTSSVVTFAPGSRNWPPICSACPAVEC